MIRDLPTTHNGTPASLFPVFLGDPGPSSIFSLARALATSPMWWEFPGAELVVRQSPRPAIGVAGIFDEAATARLARLSGHLTEALPRMRYVTYAQAEADCEVLAERLVERFGRELLRRVRFAAIPRGGLIVLGMLAYTLGLSQDQLSPGRGKGPLVVVDDCAISGSRFGGYLQNIGEEEVIFAPLYSHPDLRVSIEAAEPSVAAVVSARDLYDYAPQSLGEDYMAWRRRWESREDGPRYWLGQPEHVVFPWNEPDTGIWNPETGASDRAWNMVPPELCLKNRPYPGEGPAIRTQPVGNGPLRPARDTLFTTVEDRRLLCHTRTGESFSLTGVASDMWDAIVKHGSVEKAVTAVYETYEADRGTVEEDLGEMVDELLARDLLEEGEDEHTDR